MRIVSGQYRGRVIDAPEGEGTRPTTDRVREALMSSLSSLRGGLEGDRVLDAFAGSGALGLESLSRGALYALFFERDRKAQKVIEGNLRKLGIDSHMGRLIRQDVFKFTPAMIDAPFDVVFLDPPYAYRVDDVLDLVRSLAQANALSEDAAIVYEHAQADRVEVDAAIDAASDFQVEVTKKYGITAVTMMRFEQ